MSQRLYYIESAKQGLTMPIGTDLVLQECQDPEAVLRDGNLLGQVVVASAERWRTPLAVPLMDLRLEKEALALAMGAEPAAHETYHIDRPVDNQRIAQVMSQITEQPTVRMRATCDAIRYVATIDGLIPIGMCIGPFSFATKLLADPIMPVFLAGAGSTAEDDPEVELFESVLALGEEVILAYVQMQIKAGAGAILVCEPAANIHYLSPKQLEAGADTFDRYVMRTNQRLKALLDLHEVDLIFHNCGELTGNMVRRFGELNPAIISLGSSRVLWEDSKLLPRDIVMYGNLPSKRFYSDDAVSPEQVAAMSTELITKMAAVGRPFILGTECDVLSVKGSEQTIRGKVDVMMGCGSGLGCRCVG